MPFSMLCIVSVGILRLKNLVQKQKRKQPKNQNNNNFFGNNNQNNNHKIIKLFYELRLVVPHHLIDGTKYEACYANNNHIHQICTVCGKVSELHSTDLIRTIRETKLKRFRKDAFSLYIYGICSTCQAKITRRKGVAQKENPKT